MKTKIVIEDFFDESYTIQFTVPEINVLYRLFKHAPKAERVEFGKERWESLTRKLGAIAQVFNIESELKQEKQSQRKILARGRNYL